jgi:hypothetical protein
MMPDPLRPEWRSPPEIAQVSEQLLLVDYENIGKIDLAAIPAAVRDPFFFGASQKSVPTDFLKAALKLGERFIPIDIEGQGKNALDFHIAFYLGEFLAQNPGARCVILSKDKGFDPLVKHLVGREFAVRRAASLAECFPPAAPATTRAPAGTRAGARGKAAADAPLAKALKRLAGMAENKRPHKRKGLVAELHSHLAKKLSEAEVEALVDQLAVAGKLSDANGRITYHF